MKRAFIVNVTTDFQFTIEAENEEAAKKIIEDFNISNTLENESQLFEDYLPENCGLDFVSIENISARKAL